MSIFTGLRENKRVQMWEELEASRSKGGEAALLGWFFSLFLPVANLPDSTTRLWSANLLTSEKEVTWVSSYIINEGLDLLALVM